MTAVCSNLWLLGADKADKIGKISGTNSMQIIHSYWIWPIVLVEKKTFALSIALPFSYTAQTEMNSTL